MACPLLTFDSASISPRDRPARWLDALAQVCGRLAADPLGAPTIDVQMAFGALDRVQIGRIAASRHRVGLPPALARRTHHPVAKVIVQTEGRSVYEQGGERVELVPGDGLVYDVALPHQITSEGPTTHVVAIIPHELLATRGLSLARLSAQRFSARDGLGRVAASLLDATLDQLGAIPPDRAAVLADSIVNVALAPMAPATGGMDAVRYRIKRYVRDRLRDPDLSVGEIAAALGCSTRYLHRAFAGERTTITDFIWAQRLDGCRDELVRRPDRTISEVAFAWGFSSAAHFSRLFRARFGQTPSELRRSALVS